jgi:hypothetical protein
MKRRISFFISTLALSALLAVVLRNVDFSSRKFTISAGQSQETVAVPASSPTLRVAASTAAEPTLQEGEPAASVAQTPRLKPTEIQEVRVWAIRNGHKYGWVQLPRGTRVELVRDEGKYLVVRYDEVTLKIRRVIAEAGLVVPVPRRSSGLAGL